MMKKIEYILTIVLCALLCTNCSDVLDKNDLGSMSDKIVYDNAQFSLMVLDKLHRDIVPGWDGGIAEDCDESGPNRVQKYPWGQSGLDDFGRWNEVYSNIRKINSFLENLDAGALDQETKDLYSAQALVMRAWIYFDLTRKYGGVPIIKNAQTQSDDNLFAPRSKASECIQFIIQDLDGVIATGNFPYSWTGDDAGRLSKAAALALKARVLLYWASPQFNPDNDQSRWTAAYNANKEAKEILEANGYGLFDNFYTLWFEEMNREAVFVRRFSETNGHSWESGTRNTDKATGMDGWNKPTWQLAKAFPMITGEPITESPLYDDVFFWKNRDPRFAQTIAWNTCKWAQLEGVEERYWSYPPYPYANPSCTNLGCRKAINPNATEYQIYIGRNTTDWIEIRFAEVLMNLAECATEVDKLDEAYAILKQIRDRAGIIAGANGLYGLKANMSKDEMIRAIMLERQIEFAFEGKRLWDLRRRRMLQELNGMRREARMATLKMTEDEFAAYKNLETDFENEYDRYFTDVVEIAGEDKVNALNFPENYYFYPIHSEDLVTNSKLEQTRGWDNGTFDPLQ